MGPGLVSETLSSLCSRESRNAALLAEPQHPERSQIFVMYVFALFVQQLLASYLVEDGGRESRCGAIGVHPFLEAEGGLLKHIRRKRLSELGVRRQGHWIKRIKRQG